MLSCCCRTLIWGAESERLVQSLPLSAYYWLRWEWRWQRQGPLLRSPLDGGANDDGDCEDIYGNRTVTKEHKRWRSMDGGSDEREGKGRKAERKTGLNAPCVYLSTYGMWTDCCIWLGSENERSAEWRKLPKTPRRMKWEWIAEYSTSPELDCRSNNGHSLERNPCPRMRFRARPTRALFRHYACFYFGDYGKTTRGALQHIIKAAII